MVKRRDRKCGVHIETENSDLRKGEGKMEWTIKKKVTTTGKGNVRSDREINVNETNEKVR